MAVRISFESGYDWSRVLDDGGYESLVASDGYERVVIQPETPEDVEWARKEYARLTERGAGGECFIPELVRVTLIDTPLSKSRV